MYAVDTKRVREEFMRLESVKRISRLFALAKVKWLRVSWEDDTGVHNELLPTGSYAFWQMPEQKASSAKVVDVALADAAGEIAKVYPNPPSKAATGLTSAKTYTRTIEHLAARGEVTPSQQGKGTQWLKEPEKVEAPERLLTLNWFSDGKVVKPSPAAIAIVKGIQASLPEGASVHTIEIEPTCLRVYVKRNGVLNAKLPGYTEHFTEDFSYKEYPV